MKTSDFELICFRWWYDRLYLLHDAPDRRRELDFKSRHRRGSQHLSFLDCHILDIFALHEHDRSGFCASVAKLWQLCETQEALGAAIPAVFVLFF